MKIRVSHAALAFTCAFAFAHCDCGGSAGDDAGSSGDGAVPADAAIDASAPPDTGGWPDGGPDCIDQDGDSRGPGCIPGEDCDPANRDVWESCLDCRDADGDGRWGGCDAYTVVDGPDCNDMDSATFQHLPGYLDQDGDGYTAEPPDQPQQVCSGAALPPGYLASSLGLDCNDQDATRSVGCGALLIADLDVVTDGDQGSAPRQLTHCGLNVIPYLLFSADDGVHGRELWRTTGPGGTTALLADLAPGEAAISVREVRPVYRGVYLSLDDGEHGNELWYTGGSAASTRLVKDICPGRQSSNPRELTRLGSRLFFVANDCAGYLKLWVTDGSEAGTVMVDVEAREPSMLTAAGNALYFVDASSHNNLPRIYRSDGTAAGTVPIYDDPTAMYQYCYCNDFVIAGMVALGNRVVAAWTGVDQNDYPRVSMLVATSGPQDRTQVELPSSQLYLYQWSGPRMPMAVLGGRVFFAPNDLWVSDLTDAGTYEVEHIASTGGTQAADLVTAGNRLFFTIDDGSHGRELWRSDGSSDGTLLVSDVVRGAVSSDPQLLTSLSDQLFFVADDGQHGGELWQTSAAAAGARLVDDLVSGSLDSGIVELEASLGLLVLNGLNDRSGALHDDELWYVDPDDLGAGIRLLSNINSHGRSSEPQPILVDGGRLLLSAAGHLLGSSAQGEELWLSDGTAAGTGLLKEINPGVAGSNPDGFAAINGIYYFAASDGTAAGGHGRELWRSDLTDAGTYLVRDIRPGTASSDPHGLIEVSGTLFFAADDGSSGIELYKSDGTESGTLRVEDIRPGASGSDPVPLRAHNGELIFTADDGTTGRELWHSGGSSGNTAILRDIYPAGDSTPTQLTLYHGELFFTATTPGEGTELWKTGGSYATTALVLDIQPGTISGSPTHLAVALDRLVFAADNGVSGVELWSSDGSAAGTALVDDIATGATGSSPDQFIELGGFVYFAAATSTEGRELWRSDLDAAGTTRVKDIEFGSGSSDPAALQVVNGALYFSATSAASGRELYRSDGTAAGTALLKEICAGNCSAQPSALFVLPDGVTMLFGATDRTTGVELWATDGTPANTRLVQDIATGPASSSPASWTVVGNRVLFSAIDRDHGRELWAIALSEIQ